MRNNFIDFLKENFDAPNSVVDGERIPEILLKTSEYFGFLETRLRSNDPKEREGALMDALEIQQFLESKVSLFAPYVGLDLTEEEKILAAQIEETLRPNNIIKNP